MTGGLAIDDAAWASPWRTRAVRDKAVLALGLLACAVALPPWPATLLVTLSCLIVMLGPARIPARVLGRAVRVPLAFIVVGAASVLVSVTWDGGPQLAVTSQTTAQALALLGRGIAGALAVLLLAGTTPMVDLLAAMRRARLPDACIEVAALTYRLLFVLLTTARGIREAQAARLGYTTYRTSLSSVAALAGTVFVRAWDRARRLEEGLAGRGYVDALRTLDPPRHVSSWFLAASLALLAAIVTASWLGRGWSP